MQIVTPVTLDLVNPVPIPVVNVKQGDSSRGVLVSVTAAGNLVTFSNTDTANVYIKKPDGAKIYNACTVQDGKVLATFTTQATAVPGMAQVELEIVTASDRISTPIAAVVVLPSNIDSDAIESSDEFTALTAALQKVDGLFDDLDNQPVTFTRAASRANLVSGESIATLFGKCSKYFADMRTGAYATTTNALTITTSGYVLDARAGKTLNDKIGTNTASIDTLSEELAGKVTAEERNVAGIGQPYAYIANKEGYKLLNIYNYGREYNDVTITGFSFNGSQNLYYVFFDKTQATSANMALRLIWLKTS